MTSSSLAQRFWKKCDRKGEDQCWEWQGSIHRENPRFKVAGRWVTAYKVAWHLHTGDDLYDARVYHACGNKLCVNPHHIRPMETIRPKPEARYYASHTPAMRRARNTQAHAALAPYLQTRYEDDGATVRDLADELDVSPATVSRWLRRFGIEVRSRGPRPVTA